MGRTSDAVTRVAMRRFPLLRMLGGPQQVRRNVGLLRGAAERAGGGPQLAMLIAASIPAFGRLFLGIARDRRVPLRYRAGLIALAPYLLSPIDLVPDFIPVIGAMDDAMVVLLVLQWVAVGVGRDVLESHWHGTPDVLDVVFGVLADVEPRAGGRHGASRAG